MKMHLLRSAGRSATYGWLALMAVHISAAWTGIGLGFGLLTCITATVVGVPGIISLLLLNVIL